MLFIIGEVTNVTINGSDIETIQKANPNETYFDIERLTGYTVGSAEFTQYNIELKNSLFFPDVNSSVILPLLIQQTLTTTPSSKVLHYILKHV